MMFRKSFFLGFMLFFSACTPAVNNKEINTYKDLPEFAPYIKDGRFESTQEEDTYDPVIVSSQACRQPLEIVPFMITQGKCYDIKDDEELTMNDYKEFLPEEDAKVFIFNEPIESDHRYSLTSYEKLMEIINQAQKEIPIPTEFRFYQLGISDNQLERDTVFFAVVFDDLDFMREYDFYRFDDQGFYLSIIDRLPREDWKRFENEDFQWPEVKYTRGRIQQSFTYFQSDVFYEPADFYLGP